MLTNIQVGEKLRELRGSETREKVADAVGISASALGMYENGSRMPRDNVKVDLAAYFHTTVGALFFGE